MGAKSEHGLLSPSGAGCWIKCPRSVRLCENMQDEQSTYAAEGDTAHALAALYLTNAAKKEFAKIKRSKYYSSDMEQYVKVYVDHVREYEKGDFISGTEQQVDLSFLYPGDGNPNKEVRHGTVDRWILDNETKTLHVFDLKYGVGVKVEATDNPQLKTYACGLIGQLCGLFEIENIILHIVQPRVSQDAKVWGVGMSDLIQWKQNVLIPSAALAYAGAGDFSPGEHCTKYFCDARMTCKARHDFCLSVGANVNFENSELIDDATFSEILGLIHIVEKWCKDVNAYAFERMMKGNKISGFKLIKTNGNRFISDPANFASALKANGFNEIYREVEPEPLKTLIDIEKLVGKKKLAELCGSYIAKAEGKLKVVPADDSGDDYFDLEKTFGQFKQ